MNEPLDAKQVSNENKFEFEDEKLSAPVADGEDAKAAVETNNDSAEVVDIPPASEEKAETGEVSVPESSVADGPVNIGNEDGEASSEESSAEKVPVENYDRLSKVQIVEKLEVIVDLPVDDSLRDQVDLLKQAFYKQKREETEEAKKAFAANGGNPEDFAPAVDELEENLKVLLGKFKEKKAAISAEAEKIKEENLAVKKAIIEKIKALIDSQDDFYKVYNEFRNLQQDWKEVKAVPQTSVNDLWKDYQHYSEKFYDLLKINNEMRDYDFKKNFELKNTLCESVEKLESEPDVISAFYQLQKFHQEWREIGPVAKEHREEIWERFKKASAIVNKRHQEHFEALRGLEQRNLEEKTAICEEMEAINYDSLVAFKDWDEQNKRVLELQEKWRTIGFAPKKYNVKIFERFRASCDLFFQKKSNFYKSIKDSMEFNLEKKEALCVQAEALKDSEDWKETTDKLIQLQKEWKTIGPVSRKHSDVVWKRFITACDYFFEQKNKHFSSQKEEETENLQKKLEIIEKIKTLDTSLNSQEAVSILRGLMADWNKVGFVPFKEKDKIYKEYREALDMHFDRLKVDESERRLQSFRSNLSEISGGDRPKNRILNEREKLMRTYDRLKNDIQTYENNMGFLSVSSKGGGGLLKEMTRKIESLKEELDLIVKKISVIDESLEREN